MQKYYELLTEKSRAYLVRIPKHDDIVIFPFCDILYKNKLKLPTKFHGPLVQFSSPKLIHKEINPNA